VLVLGLEVPHAHIHLIPMQDEKDVLNFSDKIEMTKEEMAELTEKIVREIE
jgi:histidine triad (HIT) family protein